VIVGYEVATTTVAAVTVAAYSEFEPNGTRRAYVREVGVFSQAATAAGKTQLGRPGNTPTGGAISAPNGQDPANTAATAGITTTWTAAPTAPSAANTMRQFDFPATAGSAYIATWPPDGELIVGPTRANSLILWNGSGSTGPAMSQYVVWSE
jgi:hypothetical protein